MRRDNPLCSFAEKVSPSSPIMTFTVTTNPYYTDLNVLVTLK